MDLREAVKQLLDRWDVAGCTGVVPEVDQLREAYNTGGDGGGEAARTASASPSATALSGGGGEQ